jgi:hypothetical protein
VHFQALGHPVAGDVQYGREPRPDGLDRQFLHAARLAFPHPDDGREISCASPLPPDLSTFLGRLGLPEQPRLRAEPGRDADGPPQGSAAKDGRHRGHQ